MGASVAGLDVFFHKALSGVKIRDLIDGDLMRANKIHVDFLNRATEIRSLPRLNDTERVCETVVGSFARSY